jgi:hypothetical protein
MPEVSRDQARTAAFRLRGLGQGKLSFARTQSRMRILRRSPRPRRLLSRRRELAERILIPAAPINHRHVEHAQVRRQLPAMVIPGIQPESAHFFEEYGSQPANASLLPIAAQGLQGAGAQRRVILRQSLLQQLPVPSNFRFCDAARGTAAQL